MRICVRQSVPLLLLLGSLSGFAASAEREGPTLTLSFASESVTAGEQAGAWLNALNTSSNEVAWAFPEKIETQIISPHGTFTNELQLLAEEASAAVLAPGTFARRAYVFILPRGVSGQIILEFPQLKANRVVLDAHEPAAVVVAPETKTNSAFARFLMEAEPRDTEGDFSPGRFFKEHISGYQPFYFVAGSESPNAKFQFSFAYAILNKEGPLATKVPALQGLHFAYTQTSLWDWNAPSAPFYDSTYRPEFFDSWQRVIGGQPTNWFRLDLQAGFQHASNGKAGTDSRSMNVAYFQPTFVFGRDDSFQITIEPRAWIYVSESSDNADLKDYLGYGYLRTIVGWKRGLELSAIGVIGADGNNGSVQLDLTYPTMRLFGSFSVYLDIQYYNGYGESLLGYNQKTEQLRFGFSLFR